jgi:Ca2+-binding RTX toxin-like protein
MGSGIENRIIPSPTRHWIGKRGAVVELLERRMFLSTFKFTVKPVVPVGSGPTAVAVTDLNNDGKADLVVSNESSNSVGAALGNGDGTFIAQQTFPVGLLPRSLVVADVNGDGIPDVVAANRGEPPAFPSTTLSVLLGHGDGTFSSGPDAGVGPNPRFVTASDLNGDGKIDLVSANSDSATLSILLGNGDGTFAPFPAVAVGSDPEAVTVADLNGDRKPDLIAANRGSATLSILFGQGDGTFAPQQTLTVGGNPDSVVAADVNGDGKMDLLVANYADATVSILLGNGDGGFAPQQTVAVGDRPRCIAVSDLDGDAKLDVAVANQGSNTLGVLAGNGDGTFASQQIFAVGTGQSFVAAADVNGDGKPDLIEANANDNALGVLLNNNGPTSTITQTGSAVSGVGTSFPNKASVTFVGSNVSVTIDNVSRSFPMSSVSSIQLEMGAGDDSVTVGSGGPGIAISTGSGNDTIIGGTGNDTLAGGKGADLIRGGRGADSITGGKGRDLIFGGNGTDSEIGGGGSDTIVSGRGADLMTGGPGDDVFDNGGGTGQSINGGIGLNFVQVPEPSDSFVGIAEVLDPTPPVGAQPLVLSDAAPVPPSPNVLKGLNPLIIDGGAGDDSIVVSADAGGDLTVNNDGVVTQPGNIGAFSGILIRTHAGNDTVSASGVPLPVVIKGGSGNDSLTGATGVSALIGGAGDDTLVGGSQANLLVGAGLAFLDHANANDSLVGGPSGSDNFADFTHRTDDIFLSNDGESHDGTTIDPSVQNILAGTGADTVVSTVAGSFLNAGIGRDSLLSGGAGTTVQAGPDQANVGSDTVEASGGANVLLLANGHVDTFLGAGPTDQVATDSGIDLST